MKIIITENKLEQVAINWLNKNYGDLEEWENDKYPDFIFYKKGDKIIFDYNKKNGEVYMNYNLIWSFFESYFGMNNQQIQALTKDWVEERYNLRVTTTLKYFLKFGLRWMNNTI
jgi:hypothetical protein